MKTGLIIQFHEERQLGVIFVDSAIGERYFFFANKVIGGGKPKVGAKVIFSVAARPVQPGRMPYAINITIVEPTANAFEELTKISESLKGLSSLGGGQ